MRTSILALALLLAPSAALATQYAKVAIVAQSGGDYASPAAAITDLASWCGTANETNPCLVKIMPGVYDLGAGYLQMKSYVDVEGSGQNVTILRGYHGFGVAYFYLTSHAELRSLSLENTVGGIADAYGLKSYQSSMQVKDVTVRVVGGTQRVKAVDISGIAPSPEAVLDHVTVVATGPAQYLTAALFVTNTNVVVRNGSLTASSAADVYGVYSNYGAATVKIFDTTVNASGAWNNCIGVYNRSGLVELTGVQATADSSRAWGVYNAGGGTAKLQSCRVKGLNTVFSDMSSTYIGTTWIDGAAPGRWNPDGTLPFQCAQSFNASFQEILPNCTYP